MDIGKVILGGMLSVIVAMPALVGLCIYLAAIAPDAVMAAWCLAFSAFFWGTTTPTLFAIGMRIVPVKVNAPASAFMSEFRISRDRPRPSSWAR